jgi:hypothetical protein
MSTEKMSAGVLAACKDTWLRLMKTYGELSDRVFEVSEESAIVIQFISMMDGDGNGLIDPMERKNISQLLRSLHIIDETSLRLLMELLTAMDMDMSGTMDDDELEMVTQVLENYANGTKGLDNTLDLIALRNALAVYS